jgi:hypothetical protein
MDWSPSFHRFASEQAFLDALAALGWSAARPPGVALDVIGPLHRPGAPAGTDPDTGGTIPDAVPVPGWHVNAAWCGDMPAPFVVSRIEPATPYRVWA